MTPLEAMAFAASLPFCERHNNCADAAVAALCQHPKALAWLEHKNAMLWPGRVLEAATDAAHSAGLRGADASGPAVGVAFQANLEPAIAARIDGRWWRRGAFGVRPVPASAIVAAWSVD